MKKITKLLSLAVIFTACSVNAAKIEIIELEDNSKILGKWHVYAAAPARHKEKRAQDAVWNFKNDGTMTVAGKDVVSGRTNMMLLTLKYSIENGQIRRQSSPGREKYESCGVVELSEKDMILKCPFLFYYLKKM